MYLISVLVVCALAFIVMLIAVYTVAIIYEAIKECFEFVVETFFKKKIRFNSEQLKQTVVDSTEERSSR